MIWRRRNKSSIIHQINKENKKAYRERIIERNRKAKELQAKQEELNKQNEALKTEDKPIKEKTKTKPIKNKANDKARDGDFDDILNAGNNPSRVKDYSAEPKVVGRKEKYSANNVGTHGVKLEENKKQALPMIKEISKEQKLEKPNDQKVSDDKNSESFLDRDLSDDSSSSEDSDINDRADWKSNPTNKKPEFESPIMEGENKPDFKLGGTNSHIKKMDKDAPSEVEEESDNT